MSLLACPRSARVGLVLACVSLASACGGSGPDDGDDPKMCGSFTPLVDHLEWQYVPELDDPFGPPETTATFTPEHCPDSEVMQGVEFVSVATGHCSWVTVETTAMAEASQGEELAFRMWLMSPEVSDPAQGTTIVTFDGEPVVTKTEPLPERIGRNIEARVALPMNVTTSTKIHWHVSNHGQNVWLLSRLGVTRQYECP